MVSIITLLHQLPLEEPGELVPNKPAALLYIFYIHIYIYICFLTPHKVIHHWASCSSSWPASARASSGSEATLCWRNKYEIQSLRPRRPRHPWSCWSARGSPGPKKCAGSRSRPLELLSLTCFRSPSFFVYYVTYPWDLLFFHIE